MNHFNRQQGKGKWSQAKSTKEKTLMKISNTPSQHKPWTEQEPDKAIVTERRSYSGESGKQGPRNLSQPRPDSQQASWEKSHQQAIPWLRCGHPLEGQNGSGRTELLACWPHPIQTLPDALPMSSGSSEGEPPDLEPPVFPSGGLFVVTLPLLHPLSLVNNRKSPVSTSLKPKIPNQLNILLPPVKKL